MDRWEAGFYLLVNYLPFFLFMFGLCLGSFLNVCIFRLLRGESIVFPASHCLQCGHKLAVKDNIPLLSFILLRGKCRYCQTHLSFQYPIVELLTATLFALAGVRFGWQFQTITAIILISASLVISVIDLREQIIPHLISLPGIGLGLILSLLPFSPVHFTDALTGALLGGGLFFLIQVLSKGGMGGGDVNLIAMFGAFLGWQKCLLTIFVAVLIGSMVGGLLILLKQKGRKDPIPFGPFLCLGALVSLFYGQEIITWYFSLPFK